MALTSTMHTFDVALSNVDRGVYETLAIKAARHPSESEEYLAVRVLAYCLEYAEGIAFSRGLSEPDEPAISVRDLTGALKSWIEIGAPDAARLHKASKASPRVAVYTHKDPRLLLRGYEGQRIHRAEQVELYAPDRELVDALVRQLDRRVSFALTVTDGQLFLDVGGRTVSGALARIALPG
ncbi:MAG: YaeQ family protein [Gemmatimonadota bacterium]|nr:YaeQ family protein [Gemmatimonadota bacterium]MDE3126793.1 YaeQ family protein [Gemmatimonadota bacterium]MDE3173961.1 YaeQ family protein [Gemmatimonadota bacterium]MDE3216112.1 YaeQ family protein [Gemmatimonadota bacterium]